MIVVGGYSNTNSIFDELLSFDLNSHFWTKQQPKGTGPVVAQATMVSVEDELLGGNDNTLSLNVKYYRYHILGINWI